MGLKKRQYTDRETLITAENLNDIQNAILDLEDGLFSVDNDKSGVVITMTDAAKRGFRSFNIYGKTTQDGTPTPDTPGELVSVGDSGSVQTIVCGKNLLNIPEASYSFNDVTLEAKGSVAIMYGTATGAVGIRLVDKKIVLPAGTYTFSIDNAEKINRMELITAYLDGTAVTSQRNLTATSPKATITATADFTVSMTVVVASGTALGSAIAPTTIFMQIEVGTTATDYEPYKAQTFTTFTPNGLPGIPVASGGNYTDENGQQWICDEIDLRRGVYVQRIGSTNLTEAPWTKNDSGKYFTTKNHGLYSNAYRVMCTHIKGGIPSDANKENVIFINANNDIRLNITLDGDTVEAVTRVMNGAVLIGVLITPIETPLPEEELAAYATLYTYKDHTTVSNDALAHMELEYVIDAKKYIDEMLQPTARIANVKLLASAWVGSGNLYSQVISIDGVTKNSQVNLTPSVSQMVIFYEKDITFITENDGGVVTVYVIGQKPQNDYTIQANIVEVVV